MCKISGLKYMGNAACPGRKTRRQRQAVGNWCLGRISQWTRSWISRHAGPLAPPRASWRPLTQINTMTLRAHGARPSLRENVTHWETLGRSLPPLQRSILYGHESQGSRTRAHGPCNVQYTSEKYLIRYFSELGTAAAMHIMRVKYLAQGHLKRGRSDYSPLVVLGFLSTGEFASTCGGLCCCDYSIVALNEMIPVRQFAFFFFCYYFYLAVHVPGAITIPLELLPCSLFEFWKVCDRKVLFHMCKRPTSFYTATKWINKWVKTGRMFETMIQDP